MKPPGKVATNPGHNRTSNEDFHLINAELGLYIICDGSQIGDGKWAAKTTSLKIQEFILKNQDKITAYQKQPSRPARLQVEQLVAHAIQYACKAVYAESKTAPNRKNSLTTVEVLLILEDYAVLGHIGNSRTYRVRDGKTSLLTRDHTHYESMLESGLWTKDHLNPQFKKRLIRAVGLEETVAVVPQSVSLALGDIFVLCTDGLSDYLTETPEDSGKEISDLSVKVSVDQLPTALVDFAFKKGSKDNITALVIQVVQTPGVNAEIFNIAYTKKQVETLRNIPILSEIRNDEASLLKIHSLATPVKVKAGTTIIREGDQSDEMFIIVNGSVDVVFKNESVAARKEGDVVGEMGFFNRAPRSTSVVAATEVLLLSVRRVDYDAMVRVDKELGLKIAAGIIRDLSTRVQKSSDMIASLKGVFRK